MKTIFILLLFFCNSLQAQTLKSNQTLENQLVYFKSNPEKLLDENRNDIFSQSEIDSLLILYGDSVRINFGGSVSNAGDVNGDGYDDVIIGASGNGGVIGRVYIFYGGLLMDNIPDVIIRGTENIFGKSVSTAGDVNGDGFSDVIVGNEYYSGAVGRAYIYFGGATMDNITDVTFTGEAPSNFFGGCVSSAGDVNGDGYSDVIVGAYQYDLNSNDNIGRAYIFLGGISMNNVADVIMTGEAAGNIFGKSVSTAGDVNGDGFSDVIVGNEYYSGTVGRAYIYFGGATMDNIADVTFTGEASSNYFGGCVSTAGDVNGDGYSDVIVGARSYGGVTGRVYIFHGGASMNDVPDVIMTGEGISNPFGSTVSTAGDVNNDGYSDVIIGASGINSTYKGYAYVYFGGVSMNNVADLTMTGEAANNFFGSSVSTAGDVNNDGYSDVIVGAGGFNDYTGRAYLYKTVSFIRIKLKVLMEGMYYQFFNQMIRKDTVNVYLRNITFPYEIVDSAKGIIDSLTFSNVFDFINAPSGTYHIVVKHFNSIETWSKAGGESITIDGTIYSYDFTTSASKAYGNNQKLKGSKYCIYGGNVNGDAIVDASDLSDVDNDSYAGLSGRYLRSDVNGDGFVDASDITIVDNNRAVVISRPYF